jgi:hypothetical protein
VNTYSIKTFWPILVAARGVRRWSAAVCLLGL